MEKNEINELDLEKVNGGVIPSISADDLNGKTIYIRLVKTVGNTEIPGEWIKYTGIDVLNNLVAKAEGTYRLEYRIEEG